MLQRNSLENTAFQITFSIYADGLLASIHSDCLDPHHHPQPSPCQPTCYPHSWPLSFLQCTERSLSKNRSVATNSFHSLILVFPLQLWWLFSLQLEHSFQPPGTALQLLFENYPSLIGSPNDSAGILLPAPLAT